DEAEPYARPAGAVGAQGERQRAGLSLAGGQGGRRSGLREPQHGDVGARVAAGELRLGLDAAGQDQIECVSLGERLLRGHHEVGLPHRRADMASARQPDGGGGGLQRRGSRCQVRGKLGQQVVHESGLECGCLAPRIRPRSARAYWPNGRVERNQRLAAAIAGRGAALYFLPPMVGKRFARREDLGLTPAEFALLRRLDTPRRIQAFVYGLKQNFELGGETCLTVREVLRTRRAHCIEGAMLAACAFWVHGEPPLLLDMRAVRDFDHVVALYRRHDLWGAISKT